MVLFLHPSPMQQHTLSLTCTGNVMNKTCVCGKTLPYKTDEDINFYNQYHSQCTSDTSILDSTVIY